MKLRALAVPFLMVGLLQLTGCTTTRSGPVPGGAYLSTSAGAHFDQAVQLVDPPEGQPDTLASFVLLGAHRPQFAPDTIFVAAANRGFVVSSDGGQSWRLVTVPLSTTYDVVALPSGTVVVTGADDEGQGYVLRTGDQGRSWQTVLTVPNPTRTGGFQIVGGAPAQAAVVISIALDPFNGERIYAGTSLGNIFLGEQSGKTWRNIFTLTDENLFYTGDQVQFGIQQIVPSPHREGELLIITNDNKFYRITAAEEQEELEIPQDINNPTLLSGGQHKKVLDAAYVPQFPDALFVGVNDGAVISRDAGQTWEQLPLPVDTIQQFNAVTVTVSPTNPSRMFVGINDVVYRSEDGGISWNTFSLNLPQAVITDILINPTNASNVVAITTPIQT